jgi:hypothetical protein
MVTAPIPPPEGMPQKTTLVLKKSTRVLKKTTRVLKKSTRVLKKSTLVFERNRHPPKKIAAKQLRNYLSTKEKQGEKPGNY